MNVAGSCEDYGFGSHWCSCVTLFQVSTTSNWHDIMQRILESKAGYGGVVYFIVTYVILHMVIINLFVAIAYEAYNKFVSKPRQTLKRTAVPRDKSASAREQIRSQLLHLGTFFKQYTAGSREAASTRLMDRSSVTLRRKSSRAFHQKISDDSLNENMAPIDELSSNGVIEVGLSHATIPSCTEPTSRKERKQEKILKEKMMIRNAARKMRSKVSESREEGVVLKHYTAQGDEELTLAPGQKVSILLRVGTKCKGFVINGNNFGRTGWFPAFVINTINKNTSTPPKAESTPKFVKKQKADWTKDIIGPMTIMNVEELHELNKILKASARKSRSSDGPENPSSGETLTDRSVLRALVEEEESVLPPEVIVRQPSNSVLQEEYEEQDLSKLQSPKVAEEIRENKKRLKNSDIKRVSDIPDWAQKLLSQSNRKLTEPSTSKACESTHETHHTDIKSDTKTPQSNEMCIEDTSDELEELGSSNTIWIKEAVSVKHQTDLIIKIDENHQNLPSFEPIIL